MHLERLEDRSPFEEFKRALTLTVVQAQGAEKRQKNGGWGGGRGQLIPEPRQEACTLPEKRKTEPGSEENGHLATARKMALREQSGKQLLSWFTDLE